MGDGETEDRKTGDKETERQGQRETGDRHEDGRQAGRREKVRQKDRETWW